MTKRWSESIRNRIFRIYELNERQKEKVGKVLDVVFREQRIAMGRDFERMRELRANAMGVVQRDLEKVNAQLVENRKANPNQLPMPPSLWDDDEFLIIQKHIQAIEKRHPLDWNKILTRVEKLLPDEQARKGREAMRKDVPLWLSKGSPDVTSDGKTNQRGKLRAIHPWEQFVRSFIREHKLTQAQAAAAMSILKELLKRAAFIEKTEANATVVPDDANKDKRLSKLIELRQQQIDQLFEELKTRLNHLLTTPQNQKQVLPPQEKIMPAR